MKNILFHVSKLCGQVEGTAEITEVKDSNGDFLFASPISVHVSTLFCPTMEGLSPCDEKYGFRLQVNIPLDFNN